MVCNHGFQKLGSSSCLPALALAIGLVSVACSDDAMTVPGGAAGAGTSMMPSTATAGATPSTAGTGTSTGTAGATSAGSAGTTSAAGSGAAGKPATVAGSGGA